MKNQSKGNSLVAILGTDHPNISAFAARNVSTGGDDSLNNRSIRIQRNEMIDQYSPAESFESIVNKIAAITTNRREEMENILIATGSPIAVRRMNRRQLNSEIQNRLVSPTENGRKFRLFVTAMVANDYGDRLVEDGFFEPSMEGKVGSSADLENPWTSSAPNTSLGNYVISTGSTSGASTAGSTVTPYVQNESGGVTQTKTEQDWGSILSGSAQLINSVGGVVGMFTGGAPATPDNNIFNPKTEVELAAEQAQYDAARKSRNTKIVLGVLGAIVLIVVVVVIVKKAKKKGSPKK